MSLPLTWSINPCQVLCKDLCQIWLWHFGEHNRWMMKANIFHAFFVDQVHETCAFWWTRNAKIANQLCTFMHVVSQGLCVDPLWTWDSVSDGFEDSKRSGSCQKGSTSFVCDSSQLPFAKTGLVDPKTGSAPKSQHHGSSCWCHLILLVAKIDDELLPPLAACCCLAVTTCLSHQIGTKLWHQLVVTTHSRLKDQSAKNRRFCNNMWIFLKFEQMPSCVQLLCFNLGTVDLKATKSTANVEG